MPDRSRSASARTISRAAWLNGAGSLAIDRVKGLSFALSVQGSGAAEIGDVGSDQLNVGIVGTGQRQARRQGRTS